MSTETNGRSLLRLCCVGAAGFLLLVACVAPSGPGANGGQLNDENGNGGYGTPDPENPKATETPHTADPDEPPFIDFPVPPTPGSSAMPAPELTVGTGPDAERQYHHRGNEQCVYVGILDSFEGDTQIVGVTVGDEPAFTLDPDACEGYQRPSCDDFVFEGDDEDGRCALGVYREYATATEEDYERGHQEGWIKFEWQATCYEQKGEYCGRLPEPPPEEGTTITYENQVTLLGELPDSPPETPTPTTDPDR